MLQPQSEDVHAPPTGLFNLFYMRGEKPAAEAYEAVLRYYGRSPRGSSHIHAAVEGVILWETNWKGGGDKEGRWVRCGHVVAHLRLATSVGSRV